MPASPLFIGLHRRDVNEAFVDLTYHLGINGDLLIERAILGDGEVIVFKKIKNYLETEHQRFWKSCALVEVVLGEQTSVEIGCSRQRFLDFFGETDGVRRGICY